MFPDADQLVAVAEETMRRWKNVAIERGASGTETMVKQGIPWHCIVELATQLGCDLIVMGTQGRTGLKYALLGSVAEKVVRHASCSVLVVRDRAGPAHR